MKGVLSIAILIIVIGVGMGALSSGPKPITEYRTIILPDEEGVREAVSMGTTTKRTHSAVGYKYESLDELWNLIEDYHDDPFEIENSIEELRREQETIKELLQKIERERIKRQDEKHFWTLKYREL